MAKKNIEQKVVPIQALVTKMTTMSKQGLRIQLDTIELHPDDSSNLFKLAGGAVWVILKNAEFEQKDLDDLDLPDIKVEKGEKTPSQRLRAVIYVEWEQLDEKKKEIYKTFESYYRHQMELIINWKKNKLN